MATLAGLEAYVKAHPDQFEWAGAHLTTFGSFNWDTEVEALKDCDYVIPPVPMTSFVRQYRDLGYTATFIGSDAHLAFFGLLDEADLWDECDGMLFSRETPWWNEEGDMISLTKEILYENRPDDAEKTMRSGYGYLTVSSAYIMLELIAETVESVGPRNFTSQALYDTAQSFSLTYDGCEHSYTETKRYSTNSHAMYELRAADKDIFRLSPEWYPIECVP